MAADSLESLSDCITRCTLCADDLPPGPRPIVQLSGKARVLIASQAPGRAAHLSGIPFDDASGRRLRDWMGLDKATFYDAANIAILPMGFCYPGKGASGDLPPLPQCAHTWRQQVLDKLVNLRLVLVIGRHAMGWHLPGPKSRTLTELVRNWRDAPKGVIPLPHPSPLNNRWLAKNAWFEAEMLPIVKQRIAQALER